MNINNNMNGIQWFYIDAIRYPCLNTFSCSITTLRIWKEDYLVKHNLSSHYDFSQLWASFRGSWLKFDNFKITFVNFFLLYNFVTKGSR